MDSKKVVVVDQIIDDVAVLEDQGVTFNVAVSELPDGIHDGTMLVVDNGEYHIDLGLEKEKKEDLRSRIERLKALKKDE